MGTQDVERILLAGGTDADVMRLLDACPSMSAERIERVATSRAATERLRDPRHRIALALIDRDIGPEPAQSVIQFVRRDPESPYPGLAMGLLGDAITQSDLRQTIRAGCLLTLSRPFNRQALAGALRAWPTDRADFIVCGGYVGPDRRRASDAKAPERRASALPEQAVASTAGRYDIAAETIGFRFKRFPGIGSSPALALRNGLPRSTVLPALGHIGRKKREGLSMIGRQSAVMGKTWSELQATLAPPLLSHLNGQASASARLSTQRGLTLLGAITGSLAQYSSGKHSLGPRLVAFLRAHLDGVGAALKHRIDDDGGPTGRQIMATLKEAERAFAGDPRAVAGRQAG